MVRLSAPSGGAFSGKRIAIPDFLVILCRVHTSFDSTPKGTPRSPILTANPMTPGAAGAPGLGPSGSGLRLPTAEDQKEPTLNEVIEKLQKTSQI